MATYTHTDKSTHIPLHIICVDFWANAIKSARGQIPWRAEIKRRGRDKIGEQRREWKKRERVKNANRKITRHKLTKHSHSENRVKEGNEVERREKGKAQKEFWLRSESVIAEMTKKTREKAERIYHNAESGNRFDWAYFSKSHKYAFTLA